MPKQTFTIGVFALIKDEQNRVLLALRTDRNWWNLPGGSLEAGEAPWEGVVREVREETGLDVSVQRLLGVYSKIDKNDLVLSFECQVLGGELTLNDEAADLKYFAVNELPEKLYRNHRERIEDYFLNNNQQIFFKRQSSESKN
ncbi:MAG TPA: NUDIX domain-containing protein [bacterium]|nr:NUDIX domain-containing protein [bacterium]